MDANCRPSLAWGRGNFLVTTVKPRKSARTHIWSVQQVCWGGSLYYPASRKLISEASGIFVALQNLEQDEVNKAENQKKLTKICHCYRSIIKACIDNWQACAEDAANEDAKMMCYRQCQMFNKMELIWHLCEILFTDIQPGGILLSQLLNWLQWHFPDCEKTVNDILASDAHINNRENHPEYWNTVIGCVLQGRINEARKLLLLHNNCKTEAFLSMDELLRKMPMFLTFVENNSISEFEMKWQRWQDECKKRHDESDFIVDKNLTTISRILCGDIKVFEECVTHCETWYHMLISRLLYTNPTIRGSDLHYISQECIDMFGGNSQLNAMDTILLSLLEFDIIEVIKECSYYFDNHWFVAHLTDFLYHCKHLEIDNVSTNVWLRESLLLDFASCLMSHESLWQIGVEYFKYCPIQGKRYLEAYLPRIPLESDWKIRKIMSIAEKNELHELTSSISKVVGLKMLHKMAMGTSLTWALKSKDSSLSSCLADKFLQDLANKGRFCSLDLVDNLGTAMLTSDKLTFLGKYREFHQLYAENEFAAATSLLVSLLSSRLAPSNFWLTLLMDALPLLESPEIHLSSEQSYELLYCLEELKEVESKKNMNFAEKGDNKTGTTPEEENLMRLALARNLARAFLFEKSVQ